MFRVLCHRPWGVQISLPGQTGAANSCIWMQRQYSWTNGPTHNFVVFTLLTPCGCVDSFRSVVYHTQKLCYMAHRQMARWYWEYLERNTSHVINTVVILWYCVYTFIDTLIYVNSFNPIMCAGHFSGLTSERANFFLYAIIMKLLT